MADPLITPEFRVSFPAVFRPDSFGDGDPKFRITMLFPKGADLGKLKKAVKATAIERWGDKLPEKLRSPFRDGSEKEHLDGYEAGVTFVPATSDVQPNVCDRNKEEILSARDFYAGCYARAILVPFAYDTKGNKGVSFGLRDVQKIRDGDPFGGGGSMKEMFDELDPIDDDLGDTGTDNFDPFA